MLKVHIITHDKTNTRASQFIRMFSEGIFGEVQVSTGNRFKKDIDLLLIQSYSGMTDAQINWIMDRIARSDRNFYTIADLPEYFLDYEEDTEAYIATAVISDMATCADEDLQNTIFQYCGIMPRILEDVIEKEDITPPDNYVKPMSSVRIGWFGLPIDIMSVKKTIVNNKKRIDLFSTKRVSGLADVRKQNTFLDSDSLIKKLKPIDVIYLPKVSDYRREPARLLKVIDAIMLGKFVVAPDLQEDVLELAFDDTLEEALSYYSKNDINTWVRSKQDILLETYTVKNIAKKLFDYIENESKEIKETPYASETEHKTWG